MLLDLARLRLALHDAPVGHTLDYHHTVASTMPLAHDLAKQPGTRSGVVVVAEEQTAGRGRLARRWEAPPGQALLLSVILHAPLPFAAAELSMRTAVAVALALEDAEPHLRGRVGLKWPNDLLLGDSPPVGSKVAGILIESAWQGDELRYSVLGIGINVNQGARELPAALPGAPTPTSVRSFLRQPEPIDRTGLLQTLCHTLGEQLACAGEAPPIYGLWRARLWTLGQWVNVYEVGALVWQGQAVDAALDGTLFVVNARGEMRRFSAGEVTLRPYGSLSEGQHYGLCP